jgi:hypothetical protein
MFKKKARNARKRPFHSKGVRKAPTHGKSYSACTKYHDYYTTITIPEHVGTRSVCISMNDILCPEVNFNPAFSVPGCRFLERPELGQFDSHLTMMQNSDLPVSRATRDYKFLMRKQDETLDTNQPFEGMEIHSKQMARRFKSSPNIMRGNILRLTRGTYGEASVIRGLDVDQQYSGCHFLLVGRADDGSLVSKDYGVAGSDTENHLQSNCAVLGTVCKGNYFIPRNGGMEYFLKQTRSFNSDPATRKEMVLPSGEMKYVVGYDGTGIHGCFLQMSGAFGEATGNRFEEIARHVVGYSCGGAYSFGLGFRPDALPGYVPSYSEVKDRTIAVGLRLEDSSHVPATVVQPGGEVDAPVHNMVDLTQEMDGLWRNLSGRDQSEIMRCIALTKDEERQLEAGRPEIRSKLAGGTVYDLRPPDYWCHDNAGQYITPDVVSAAHETSVFTDHHTLGYSTFNRGVQTSTHVAPMKKIVQQARGVKEMVKIFDHSMVVGSKMDIELIGTGVKDRAIINENGVNVVSAFENAIEINRSYNNDASYTPRIKCEWGVQKCYPKDEQDFGIPTFKAEDTHERLPAMGERLDAAYNYSHFYDNMTVDECVNGLHKDWKNKTRKDMFKLKGHVVDAMSLRGKTKLSAKYDMNSSIKRYRIYYPDGTKKGDGNAFNHAQPLMKKDHRYVVNHRAVEADQEELHTNESIINRHDDYDPLAQQSKNYDMREKYMPVFRVFSRRASAKDIKSVDRQTSSSITRGQMTQVPQNVGDAAGGVYEARGAFGGTVVGAGDGNLDAVRLGEMAPLSNHASVQHDNSKIWPGNSTSTLYASTALRITEENESKVDAPTTDLDIDGPKFNGVIDSERRRHLTHLKTPAMTFRVRVRYKVRWWNTKETNPVVPFEDTKKSDVQESTFRHTSMNNDFIAMTDAENGSSRLEDMEDADIDAAEQREAKRPKRGEPTGWTVNMEQFNRTIIDLVGRENITRLGTLTPKTWTVADVERFSKKGSYGDIFEKVVDALDRRTVAKQAGLNFDDLAEVKKMFKEHDAPSWATHAVTLVSSPTFQAAFTKVVGAVLVVSSSVGGALWNIGLPGIGL